MQCWPVPLSSSGMLGAPQPAGAAAALIECIARPDFDHRALARLNGALPVAWWTVYRIAEGDAPHLCAQASHAVPDVTLDCWRIYRSGVYRDDTHLQEARSRVRDGASAQAVMTHCVADDFGPAHREQIYVAHGLSERLSVVSAGDAGSLLAVNLYRHRAQARFGAAEIDAVFALAPALLAVVRRHLEMSAESQRPDEPPGRRLRRRCPELTSREVEVCERLLLGWTHDGIAADLRLSPTTVKTYRNRAFGRLGIHHRNQLFPLAHGLPQGCHTD